MQVHTTTNTIERSGNFKERHFSMKACAKAFKIFSDNLYSNKKQAVIREICCNAADAHILGGTTDIPFVVHLPTTDEPFFYVRDYGVGLSESDIYQVYTTYFESSKDQSNDFTGALGLGSKSPFCVSDQFSVTSYFGGRRTEYSCFYDEDGIPTVAKLTSAKSDEKPGLEVRVPVNSAYYECNEWKDAAILVLQFFKNKPTIIGNSVKIPDKTKTYEGTSWYYSKNNNRCTALMGNVAYPITTGHNFGHIFANSNNVVMEFPIGELDIAPSREALSYDKVTLNNIDARCTAVADEYAAFIAENIAKCQNYYEAWKFRADQYASGILGNYYEIMYDGKRIVDQLDVPITVTRYTIYGGKMRNYTRQSLYGHEVEDMVLCVFNDSTKRATEKVRYLLREGKGVVYTVHENDLPKLQELGIPLSDIIKLDDVVLPKRTYSGGGGSRPKRDNTKYYGYQYNVGNAFVSPTMVEIDTTKDFFYLPQKDRHILWQGREYGVKMFNSKSWLFDGSIYLVNEKTATFFQDKQLGINFFDYYIKKLNDFYAKYEDLFDYDEYKDLKVTTSNLHPDNPIKKLGDLRTKFKKLDHSIRSGILNINSYLTNSLIDGLVPKAKKDEECLINKLIKEAQEKFPLWYGVYDTRYFDCTNITAELTIYIESKEKQYYV